MIDTCSLDGLGCLVWTGGTDCTVSGDVCVDLGEPAMCVEPGGENCTDPFVLAEGFNGVAWNSTTADYFTADPPCNATDPDGPDVLLQYTATSVGTGFMDIVMDKPTSQRYHMVVSDVACGTMTPALGCYSDSASATMGGRLTVTGGTSYWFYVVDTTTGTGPLPNPFGITINETDCAGFSATPSNEVPANGTTARLPVTGHERHVRRDHQPGGRRRHGHGRPGHQPGVRFVDRAGGSHLHQQQSDDEHQPGYELPARGAGVGDLDRARRQHLPHAGRWDDVGVRHPVAGLHAGRGRDGRQDAEARGVGHQPRDRVLRRGGRGSRGLGVRGRQRAICTGSRRAEARPRTCTRRRSRATQFGYAMLIVGQQIFTLDSTTTAGAAHLWRISANGGVSWAADAFATLPDDSGGRLPGTHVSQWPDLHGSPKKARTGIDTQIWSVNATPGSLPDTAVLERSIAGELYCSALAMDDVYYYLGCSTGNRVIRVDRLTGASTVLTTSITLASSAYVNQLYVHDLDADGLADVGYLHVGTENVYYFCDPATAPFADLMSSWVSGTSPSGNYGLGFDLTGATLWGYDDDVNELVRLR